RTVAGRSRAGAMKVRSANRSAGSRLGVADRTLDRGKAPPQRALDLVDLVMYLGDREGGVDQAMEIDDLAVVGLAHPHVVHLADEVDLGRDPAQRLAHRRDARGRRLAAAAIVGLQGLDVRLDLDVGPELVADRLLEPSRDVMRRGKRKRAVDLEIER